MTRGLESTDLNDSNTFSMREMFLGNLWTVVTSGTSIYFFARTVSYNWVQMAVPTFFSNNHTSIPDRVSAQLRTRMVIPVTICLFKFFQIFSFTWGLMFLFILLLGLEEPVKLSHLIYNADNLEQSEINDWQWVYTRKPRMRNVDHTIFRLAFSLSKTTIRDRDTAVRSSINICAATRNSVYYIVSDLTVQIYSPKNTFTFRQPKSDESVREDNQTFRQGNNPWNVRLKLKLDVIRVVGVAFSMECLHQCYSHETYYHLVTELDNNTN